MEFLGYKTLVILRLLEKAYGNVTRIAYVMVCTVYVINI